VAAARLRPDQAPTGSGYRRKWLLEALLTGLVHGHQLELGRSQRQLERRPADAAEPVDGHPDAARHLLLRSGDVTHAFNQQG
jgi:hypothetical protein